MPTQTPAPVGARIFNEIERQALYDIITARRDVRNEFLPKPIETAVLRRILEAAHAAPSVGFMQPWNFILIDAPNQTITSCGVEIVSLECVKRFTVFFAQRRVLCAKLLQRFLYLAIRH